MYANKTIVKRVKVDFISSLASQVILLKSDGTADVGGPNFPRTATNVKQATILTGSNIVLLKWNSCSILKVEVAIDSVN